MTVLRIGAAVAAVVLVACGTDRVGQVNAQLDVAPASLEYGRVPVGLGVVRELTLTNKGRARLEVDASAVEGATAGSFRVVDLAPTVPPGDVSVVRLEFRPELEGALEATLVLKTTADGAAELRVPLRGEGIPRSVCGACDQPPPNYCTTAAALIAYASNGQCVEGACRYSASVVACAGRCNAARGACEAAEPDAGAPDAGALDAGTLDAGAVDAGPGAVWSAPGEHTWVVPPGVTAVRARLWGGGGAGGNQQGATGGGGSFLGATVAVTPGETLDVWVAEGGRKWGSGGGASWVRRGSTVLAVAAGGGGGGSDGCSGCKSGGKGGAGGDAAGQDGEALLTPLLPYCASATAGRGGSASAGGAGGTSTGTATTRCDGMPGVASAGGRATGVNGHCDPGVGAERWRAGGGQGNGGGGGGGAGWFGGGGAGFIWTYCAGGGGGGSSHADLTASAVTSQAGLWQVPGNATEGLGAGAGGAPNADGAAGRVELRW